MAKYIYQGEPLQSGKGTRHYVCIDIASIAGEVTKLQLLCCETLKRTSFTEDEIGDMITKKQLKQWSPDWQY